MEIKNKEKNNEKFELSESGEVRVRFAPSPTGFLHIGSSRTALFNFLFAKKYQGRFILRIEDTDKERSKKEFEDDIIKNLKWLGIEWDEGPTGEGRKENGNYGPYYQSERQDIYKKYLEQLLKEDKAYYCFCSPEELEAKKQDQISRGLPPRYDGKCSNIPKEEAKKRLEDGEPAVIRFRMPKEKVSFNDAIRGKVEFDASLFGDIVIAKNLETPLYNFAAVVDDFEMKISHVIRGEDHISNTPKQILLQRALGFNQPTYAHLPLILGPDHSKLSKRHGAMSVAEYKKMGYLPEAIINFLAFLGWNPGTEREIYSLSSLIKDFSLEKIQKSGAIFNTKKLDFLNGFYIRQKPLKTITRLSLPYLIKENLIQTIDEQKNTISNYNKLYFKISETGEKISFDNLEKIISLYHERMKKISEISELANFFFKKSLTYPKELLIWKNSSFEKTKEAIKILLDILLRIEKDNWKEETLKNIFLINQENKTNGRKQENIFISQQKNIFLNGKIDRGKLLWPFRVALSGKKASPGPFEIAEILGKEKTLKRVEEAKELLDK